jgi:poly-gamma-glutamate capsule biosynthesis protein CapA/YwtB (metallophosphatase superfamily)
MISAVVPPQPLSQPQLPAPAQVPAPVSVRDRAAAGYFRDIALWINQPLVAQGIFVQVQADPRPGCLRLTVEFERTPMRDRLLRFLCHRVWLINSPLIEGIHVVARPVGWQRVLWQQRIKIVTPALKRRKANEQLTQATRLGSPLPPQIHAQRRRSKQNANQRLKTLRAFVLTGSAVAAFLLGCMLEVITTGPSPSLPSFSAQAGPEATEQSPQALTESPTPAPEQTEGEPVARGARSNRSANAAKPAAPLAARSANRPTVVDAALEPVGVIPHQKLTPVPADEVTLLFGGDISLESLDYAQLEEKGGFFAEVEDYFNADVSMVNLSTPLATAATNLNEEFQQKIRPDAVELLANSGIDIVNLTHSNLMQYGAAGLTETLTVLDSKGLYRVGAGRNAMEARRPEILDVKGKRIAYLSYAMGGNNAAMDTTALKERAGANDAVIAKEVENFKRSTAFQERAGFNAQNMPEIVQDLQALRDEVDWIVVNFRWVDHIDEKPNFVQTNLARLAIDQGADVVVGYHPTVIQGGEIYKGRPIAYSLGDFVFKPDQPIEDQDSAVLKVSLQEEQMRVEFVPVQIRDSRPKTLTGKAGETVLQRIQQASAQFDTPIQPTVVLDLKAPAVSPAEPIAPDSPFVTPDADETLLLEPEPKANPEAVSDPNAEELILPAQPETLDQTPTDGAPPLDLREQFDQNLQEWGPKVSPQQKEFQPVPQNRSGATAEDLDAQAQPELLRQLTAPLSQPTKSELSAPVTPGLESDPWTDSVPTRPSPESVAPHSTPTQIMPTEMRSTETGPTEKANPNVESLDVVTPISAPEPVEPETTQNPPAEAEPVEKVAPAPKAIPPQAEPLVGPLGSVETPEIEVSLGSGVESPTLEPSTVEPSTVAPEAP